jgi:hypothetical protein
MNDEHAAALARGVDEACADFDPSEKSLGLLGVRLVVIAGQKDDPRSLPTPFSDLSTDRGLCRAPVPFRTEIPAVDDIANEEEIVGAMMAQETHQVLGFASARAEMQVRNPNGTVTVAPYWSRRLLRTEKI